MSFELMHAPGNIEDRITYSREPAFDILNYHNLGFRIGGRVAYPKNKYGVNIEFGYFPGVGSADTLNDVYVNFSLFCSLNGTLGFLKPKQE